MFPATGLAEPFTLLPEVVVIGERRTNTQWSETRTWQQEDFEAADPLTLDAVLATDPAFSLYRRQSSLFGNPTSAGVSLRRTGATAAARTLVLRDGIPQNDPFGGWLSWTRYDPAFLESARLIPAASASVWGNQSPAGTIQLTSRPPERSGGHFSTTVGSQDTLAVSAGTEFVSSNGQLALQVNLFTLQSDGFYGLSAEQLGKVDRPLDLDTRGLDLRSVWQPSRTVTIEAAFSGFEETRGDGTVLAGNASDATDASLRATLDHGDQTWQLLAYYQQRDYSAMFSSVSDDRNFETPALNQYDVPGTGLGGGLTTNRKVNDRLDLTVGADVRHLTGETNEDAGYVNGAFLRRRTAGGEETFAGVFVQASLESAAGTVLEANARLDYWALTDGLRFERDPATGQTLRRDQFPTRDAVEPTFGLALSRAVSESLELSLAGSSSFRAPTLNELYRPFRVRNDITEANPALEPERFFSLDAGGRWSPVPALTVSNTIFTHWINEAISNVPVTDPDRKRSLGVFVPPNGSLVQRQNVEQARVAGLESRITWAPEGPVSASVAYQLTETQFTDSPAQPLLNGQAFPQSPEHQIIASVTLKPTDRLQFYALTTCTSRAFDDALGLRPLDPFWTTALGASFRVGKTLTLRARMDNIFDEEIQTGLSSNGWLSTGLPRMCWLTTEFRW